VDMALFREVRSVLSTNKAQRHIRGGLATKVKYRLEREYLSCAGAGAEPALASRGRV
jgi:putative DeoR family transcriptional regulator (stage III sporulation protein D)